MITKFGCKNIKAIKDFDSIEIRPITIIMGENSSGKSSMLQALSLLNVNKTFGNNIQRIKYNNPFSQLGDNEVIFSFDITEQNTKLTLTYIDDETDSEYGILEKVDIDSDDMEVSLVLEDSKSLEYKLNIDKIKNKDDIDSLTNYVEVYTNLKLITRLQLVPQCKDEVGHNVVENLNRIQESIKFILKP